MEKADIIAATSRAWAAENLITRANTDDMPDSDLRDALLQVIRDLRNGLENFLAESD